MSRKHTFRQIVLPIALLVPLVWLMTGCLYIPWFEQKSNPSEKDFRAMLGPPGSNRPFQTGTVTRTGIEAVLGPPKYLSLNGLATGYALHTSSRFWVYPECFAADPANRKTYIVKFKFGSDGKLQHYDIASDDYEMPLFGPGGWDWLISENMAVGKVNQTGDQINLPGVNANLRQESEKAH